MIYLIFMIYMVGKKSQPIISETFPIISEALVTNSETFATVTFIVIAKAKPDAIRTLVISVCLVEKYMYS
jgi:hypothetical protein